MRDHGHHDDVLVETCDTTEEGGYRAAVRLLGRARPRPTAIFVANDPACVGALSAAIELGLSVPRDLSLASFDNSHLANIRHTSLTSVDIGACEVGQRVTRALLDRVEDPGRKAIEYLVTHHPRGTRLDRPRTRPLRRGRQPARVPPLMLVTSRHLSRVL